MIFFHNIIARDGKAIPVQINPRDRHMMLIVLIVEAMRSHCTLIRSKNVMDDLIDKTRDEFRTSTESFYDRMGVNRALLMLGDHPCCGKKNGSHHLLKTFVRFKCCKCRRRRESMVVCLSCFKGMCQSCANAKPYQWHTPPPKQSSRTTDGPPCPVCRVEMYHEIPCFVRSECPVCMRRASKTFVNFKCGHGLCDGCRRSVYDMAAD